jgi:hypothetical protein
MNPPPPPTVPMYIGLAITAVILLTAPLDVRVSAGAIGLILTAVVTTAYTLWWRGRVRRRK